MTRIQLMAWASSLLLGFGTTPARADGANQRCASAFEEGQRSRMAGELQRAIEQFESCAGSSCPATAQRECSSLLEVARAAMPTIQFELRFGTELARRPVMLSVDEGESRRYDGEVLRVNPGKHQFVFQCEGCASLRRRIVFSEQDSKRKYVVLKPARTAVDHARSSPMLGVEAQPATCPSAGASSGAATSSEPARAPQAPTRYSTAEGPALRDKVILGSAAALATAGGLGFIGFGLNARSGERALRECAPYCSGARIAEVERSYLFANIALGSGLLALGSATIWWFGLRSSPQSAGSYAKRGGQWSLELGTINKVTRTF